MPLTPYAPGGGEDYTGSSGWGADFINPDPTGFSINRSGGRQSLWDYLKARAAALNPISSAQADILHPNLSHPSMFPLGPQPQPGPPQPNPVAMPLSFGDSGNSTNFPTGLPQNPIFASAASPSPPSANPYDSILPQARGQAVPDFPQNSTPSGAGTPKGQPSATPRPSSATRSGRSSLNQPTNPMFGQVQYRTPSGRGPLGNNPIYSTLNLANLFGSKRA